MSDTIWNDPNVPEPRLFRINPRDTIKKHAILKRLEELGYSYLNYTSKDSIYNSKSIKGVIINHPLFSPGFITYTDGADTFKSIKIGNINLLLNTGKYRYKDSSPKVKSKTILL